MSCLLTLIYNRMHKLLVLYLFFIPIILAQIGQGEIDFICAFPAQGTANFPVPCANAVNACTYSAYINCTTLPSGNQSITVINLGALPASPALYPMILPTELGNLASLTFFRGPGPGSCFPGPSSTPLLIPTEIGRLTALSVFELPYCYVSSYGFSTLPTEIGNCNLSILIVRHMAFSGSVPTQLLRNTHLTWLDLSANTLSGSVPSLATLTNLIYLALYHNSFSGALPTPPLAMTGLRQYDLSHNAFTGGLPSFDIGHINPAISALLYIHVENNQLDGTIPNNFIYTSTGTQALALDISLKENALSGTIPANLFTFVLTAVDMSENALNGSIPTQVGLATQMAYLILSYNALSGPIPPSLGGSAFTLLTIVDLSYNALTGVIPPSVAPNGQFSPFALYTNLYLNLQSNALSGTIPVLGNNGAFTAPISIDLSSNQLHLSDTSLGTVGHNITWLNLANNNFSDCPTHFYYQDPVTLINYYAMPLNALSLPSLLTLDISNCSMNGAVPSDLPGQYLHLEFNYFTGSLTPYLIQGQAPPYFVDVRLNRLSGSETINNGVGLYNVLVNYAPQDVNECTLNTSACTQLCLDGWHPVPGYTCGCLTGFKLQLDLRTCLPVCGDGLLEYPAEECDFVYSPYGCALNCTTLPGYVCGATGCSAICGDSLVVPPEQCDLGPALNGNGVSGCASNCMAQSGFSCSSNQCIVCTNGSWIPVIPPANLALFPHFRALGHNLSTLSYIGCTTCENGISVMTRNVLATLECSATTPSTNLTPCTFACSNLTVFSSASEALYILQQQWENGHFLANILQELFGLRLQHITKRSTSNQLSLAVAPCNGNMAAPMAVIRALALDIVPRIPSLQLSTQGCSVHVQASDPANSSLPIIVATVVAGVSLCLLVGLLLAAGIYHYTSSELHALPKEITWSFLDQLTHPWRWEHCGDSKAKYYSRHYERGSPEYQRVEDMLRGFFRATDLHADGIRAIYNPSLSHSFVNYWQITNARKQHSADQFFHDGYGKDEAKKGVIAQFKARVGVLEYNSTLIVPLVPVLHGTDYYVAEKIAQTGFAALSSLDAGYFGKGIYFTTCLLYTMPYCCAKRVPAVILSYLNPGHVFPVTEDHKKKDALMGHALKAGYNSHYVVTNRSGSVYKEDDPYEGERCDELVVSQECQILPAFIISLDLEDCKRHFEQWSRDLPTLESEAAYKVAEASCQIRVEIPSVGLEQEKVDGNELI